MVRSDADDVDIDSGVSSRPLLSSPASSVGMLEAPNSMYYRFDAAAAGSRSSRSTYSRPSEEDVNIDEIRGSTYRNSELVAAQGRLSAASSHHAVAAAATGAAGRESVFVRGSLMERNIDARPIDGTTLASERPQNYKGRIRTWPGLMLLLVLIGGAGFLITYFAILKHDDRAARADSFLKNKFQDNLIKGGKNHTNGKDIISDDGVIGNPKKYPKSECELPNYVSRNGKLIAVSANGTEVTYQIKGINWFGMETGQAIPFGLWDNMDNGTTAYQIANFLSDNKFNAVRLPLMAAWLLDNKVPNIGMINKQENRGINVTDYVSLLKSMVKALQYRQIGVLLSMHTLTFNDNGPLWYNDVITEDKFLEAIDVLTSNLCNQEYWNVMGIDLKNEPHKATWGDGGPKDFREGAIKIADRMLKNCPQWMGFVEGVNGQRTVTIDGEEFEYYDWYGGGLQDVKTKGISFSVEDKVVYAPHYYTPAVFPQRYLFGGGKSGAGNALNGYVELDDKGLRRRIQATMDDMFGYLASDTGPALVLGEFGGLYTKDAHPMKTTQRCTDFTIEILKKWSGGFVWSLNPESEYQYNPADTPGRYFEGLLTDDWLSTNEPYVKSMAAMDDMPDLKPMPCFPTTTLAESSDGSL